MMGQKGFPYGAKAVPVMGVVLIGLALSACGKVAPNQPPDPFVYPRSYPSEPGDLYRYQGYFPEDPGDRLVYSEDRSPAETPQYVPEPAGPSPYDKAGQARKRATNQGGSAWSAPSLLPPSNPDGSLSLPRL
ncbi:MAG: hypothetical protein ACPGOY_16440 [Rhodospirillaceae bacterium]